jgi:hypothetical protein
MAEVLVLTEEQIEDEDLTWVLVYDNLVWEGESDSHRWEEYHHGVTQYNDKYWWIEWVTGLTENQDNRYFEDYYRQGKLTLTEAESYTETVTNWRPKK